MKKFIQNNSKRYLSELFELLRIPSVSSMAEHKPDMQKAAEKYVQFLMEAGADYAEIFPTEGHPVVFAQKMVTGMQKRFWFMHTTMFSLPIPLIYGKLPFEPQIRDGAIYARGATMIRARDSCI